MTGIALKSCWKNCNYFIRNRWDENLRFGLRSCLLRLPNLSRPNKIAHPPMSDFPITNLPITNLPTYFTIPIALPAL